MYDFMKWHRVFWNGDHATVARFNTSVLLTRSLLPFKNLKNEILLAKVDINN